MKLWKSDICSGSRVRLVKLGNGPGIQSEGSRSQVEPMFVSCVTGVVRGARIAVICSWTRLWGTHGKL